MIYTVTFNPSLDYIVRLPELRLGEVNRTAAETVFPGGKGLNVSIVLHNLGVESVALGFIAGFSGEEAERRARALGVRADFIRLAGGFSRINVKIKAERETEINAAGPPIGPADVERLLERLRALGRGDVLVLAGSIPAALPQSIYEDILGALEGRGILAVVDATGDLLKNVLKYRPFLVKPNNHELGELFGVRLESGEEIVRRARGLQRLGARNVLVSLAGDGAVLVAEDGTVSRLPAPEGKVRNSTGAGDSMVAGFLAGYLRGGSLDEAFRMGVAAGSASAFSEELATREQVERLLERLGETDRLNGRLQG